MKLTAIDYPLVARGNLIYAKLHSSPVMTVHDPEMADQICQTLNSVHAMSVHVDEINSRGYSISARAVAEFGAVIPFESDYGPIG